MFYMICQLGILQTDESLIICMFRIELSLQQSGLALSTSPEANQWSKNIDRRVGPPTRVRSFPFPSESQDLPCPLFLIVAHLLASHSESANKVLLLSKNCFKWAALLGVLALRVFRGAYQATSMAFSLTRLDGSAGVQGPGCGVGPGLISGNEKCHPLWHGGPICPH